MRSSSRDRPGILARFWERTAGGSPDPDRNMRARVFVVYWVILLGLCFGWGGLHLLSSSAGPATVFFSCGIVLLGIMTFLLLSGNLDASSHILLACALLGTSLATYLTGGMRDANIAPFIMLMVTSLFLVGRRGLVWAIGALVVALAFQALQWSGLEFPDTVQEADRGLDSFLTWSSSSIVILIFITQYESARRLGVHKLHEANRAKTRFIATISHEIRTPVHVIMGMNRLLERSDLSESQKDYIDTARHNARILLALIDDLLDVSLIEFGRFELGHREFDPSLLVEEVAGVLRFIASEKGLDLDVEMSTDLPRRILGDRRRLAQVLLNIGGNAVKYTPDGSVHMQVAHEGEDPGTLRITVSDTGPGIAPADVDRIFRMFGRGPTQHEGVGLGLYITREIVDHMGGTIDVDSSPGRGSTFVVRVPCDGQRGLDAA